MITKLCNNALLIKYKSQISILIEGNCISSTFSWLSLTKFELLSLENEVCSEFPEFETRLLDLSFRKPTFAR